VGEPLYNVDHYREQAEDARRKALTATTEGERQRYLALAASWDRLADEADREVNGAMEQLMRSIRKA
jgi:hypothetical protein